MRENLVDHSSMHYKSDVVVIITGKNRGKIPHSLLLES